jgi:hypothetical protein
MGVRAARGRRPNLQAMGRDINVVEKAKRESDALRSAAGNLAPAYLSNKRAENNCIE